MVNTKDISGETLKVLEEKIDRLLCEFIHPDIAYEDQPAPLLDWSWYYVQQILQVFNEVAIPLIRENERQKIGEWLEKNERKWRNNLIVIGNLREALIRGGMLE